MSLLTKLNILENRGWELVEEAQREAEAMRAEMADCIYFTDPSARNEEL